MCFWWSVLQWFVTTLDLGHYAPASFDLCLSSCPFQLKPKLKPKRIELSLIELDLKIMFLLLSTAFNLRGETEQKLSYDFNHMLLGVFVVVNEARRTKAWNMHSQTELHDWKAKWNSIHKHEWWYCQYFMIICTIWLKIQSRLQGKNSNFEFEAIGVSKIKLYACHIRETFKVSKHNKSAGILNLTLGYLTKIIWYFRNKKHVPCFYRVIKTRVEVWESEKCCRNTSCRWVFPQPSQTFTSVSITR